MDTVWGLESYCYDWIVATYSVSDAEVKGRMRLDRSRLFLILDLEEYINLSPLLSLHLKLDSKFCSFVSTSFNCSTHFPSIWIPSWL
jgi:hypothetical protein